MADPTSKGPASAGPQLARDFATTRWSLVQRAGQEDDDDARQAALSELCQAYWYPVYAFARRQGSARVEAEDGVQAFFAELLEGDLLARADADRGRFRAYLLTCFRHFLANGRAREEAWKRGGGRRHVSIDAARAEGRWVAEPVDATDPEREFTRAWGHAVLEGALETLRAEYEAGGKGDVFAALLPTLGGQQESPGYRELAERIGATEGAVKVAALRLRRRFGELLRRRVAQTLVDPSELEDELRGLFEALS